ncbi:MAG: HAMP domain-containing histidine kinase [Pyrinomonadaceae bacterium]|nr:HAMP domain-containing histidine kinase [Phycisphaerales bacterium]
MTCRLTVRDDGPGMDPSTVLRCTEPFFTTKPKDVGLGLGLYMVRVVVERHGGKLVIESQAGKGTVFTLILPAAAVPVPLTTTLTSHAAAAQST